MKAKKTKLSASDKAELKKLHEAYMNTRNVTGFDYEWDIKEVSI